MSTQIGNGMRDLKGYKAPAQTSRAWFYGGCLIILVALLSFMEERDREHRAEMVEQQCNNTGS